MMRLSCFAFLLILLFSTVDLSAQEEQEPIAAGQDKWLGNIYSSAQRPDFESYWNQVTPENAGKWGSVERTRDTYTWAALDASYELAKSNGYPFRFHVLIWGNQQPSWIENLSPEEQLEEIAEWMDTVAARYPEIDYLEVVNEALSDPPGGTGNGNYLEALGGEGETGYDWIITAFQMARDRFQGAALMINDYNIMSSVERTNIYLEIIGLLQERELIDAIGVQAHAFSTRGSAAAMTAILDDLAETGLPIMATEFDVDGPTDIIQVRDYRKILPVFWHHPSVVGVTLWGWKPGMWRTEERAFLINSFGVERPAMEWMRNYVEAGGEETPAQAIAISTSTGAEEILEAGGTLQMVAEVTPENVTLSRVYWSVDEPEIATIDEDGLLTAVGDGIVVVKASAMDGSGVTQTMELAIATSVLGINRLRGSAIYPNPVKDGVLYLSDPAAIKKLVLYDLGGRPVYDFQLAGTNSQSLPDGLNEGLYLLQVTDIQNHVSTHRLMVQ